MKLINNKIIIIFIIISFVTFIFILSKFKTSRNKVFINTLLLAAERFIWYNLVIRNCRKNDKI
ncbi:hypothetical protein A2567_00495 [Candidatus Azambacteria bacterium RIFOXYD1_FULL_42_11]|uniref:Uncharacterized protein n=1 Tax=Candidatus Azambacteria bacterium RIFOXYD1_FULL_42_11 TaxID=1797310 RepID=A0A1F5CG59_9BACT|nr:MAG: hypothetical protein A2567_00495 [Candidatus Azambacteria bacterium RIFOXYD1_FULL_42_11]